MIGKIVVFLESVEDVRLLNHGVKLARQRQYELIAVSVEAVPLETLAISPVLKNYRLPAVYDETVCAEVIAELCREEKPEILLFPATVYSRMVAPLVAAKLQTGLVADCTGLEWSDEGFVQIRPAFGSSCLASIRTDVNPHIATVRRGAVGELSTDEVKASPPTLLLELPKGMDLSSILVGRMPKKNEQTLYNAEIIVAGGYGVGSADGFKLLEELASKLKAGLGASRAAVNAGFAPYRCQIGLTGQIVRPKLYLAFGISGAVQHLVGMEAAETVIAVNSDKNAPIFNCADFGLVGDWKNVAIRLLERLQKEEGDISLLNKCDS